MSGVQVRIGPWLAGLAIVVVAATLVAAFLVMRTPGEQRKVSLDQRRIEDLMQVARAVEAHATVQGTLPPSLSALASQRGSRLPSRDPVTGEAYGYEPLADRHYRLCASFDTDTADTGEPATFAPLQEWWHGAGRHCFERVAAERRATAEVVP